ncbi:Mariner Mos1 transposase [Araneus ventricosus]|uniref:Mariner Mos1 transposase n=1 Tax=Araneus ventricosus TaxID=182803 RepID=A0A4Y2FX81_ARAVE|nr:Mariner Mos1 transposase [Araneus ventricosus]
MSHEEVILFHADSSPHMGRSVKNMLKNVAWEVLSNPLCSPDLAPSDFHLFRSMGHTLSQQHFRMYYNVVQWIIDWFASKERKKFNWNGINTLPDRWGKCVANIFHYLE